MADATERDQEVAELLEFVVTRCGHEPESEDGPAVCDTCENIVTVLVHRIDDHRAGRDFLH